MFELTSDSAPDSANSIASPLLKETAPRHFSKPPSEQPVLAKCQDNKEGSILLSANATQPQYQMATLTNTANFTMKVTV